MFGMDELRLQSEQLLSQMDGLLSQGPQYSQPF